MRSRVFFVLAILALLLSIGQVRLRPRPGNRARHWTEGKSVIVPFEHENEDEDDKWLI